MDNKTKHNLIQLTSMDEDKIKEILLKGFSGSSFSPLYFGGEPSVAIQLQIIYELMDTDGKQKLKAGTVRAIEEWYYPAYPVNALEELAVLAAYIRATRAIDRLRILLSDQELKELVDETTYFEHTEVIIAVLSGFMPNSGYLFERLFFDPEFDYRFAAQLFLGLCEYKPDNYVEYVERFLELSEMHIREYRLDYVFSEFMRIVTMRVIEKHIEEMKQTNYLDRFRYYLFSALQYQSIEELVLAPFEIRNDDSLLAATVDFENRATLEFVNNLTKEMAFMLPPLGKPRDQLFEQMELHRRTQKQSGWFTQNRVL